MADVLKWPLDSEPYPLIDGWADGAIEEKCWVPVAIIDGPEYAEARATGGRMAAVHAFLEKTLDYAFRSLAEDHLTLMLREGTVWERPEGQPDGAGGYFVPTEDPCDDHESEGPCWRCRDTGKLHLHYDEGCPWIECQPTDENAVEFYVLEVVDGG